MTRNLFVRQTAATGLRIAAPPGPVLVDDPRGVIVKGCEPGSRVVVQAHVEIDHMVREAVAAFRADHAGTVDTGRDASLNGTYTGADPFGLWWSGNLAGPPARGIPSPVSATVSAEADGRTGQAIVERLWLAPGATVTEVREPGVWGLFARPPGPGPFPAVVAFAGSSGVLGPAGAWAPVLASHGIAALAIAYFGAPGLPDALVRIDVEVVGRAAEWLLRRPDVADRPVAAMGMSRGSELAPLAGALLEPVGPVVAFAPSGVCWAGLGPQGPAGAPAWRFGGEDIPCAGIHPGGLPLPAAANRTPIALMPYYQALLADHAAIRAAEIPVEQVKGPILMVSGEADAMWPSADMAEIAERRAAERGFPHQLTHLRYAGAGHLCGGIPGTPSASALARAASWPQAVRILLAEV
jgi:dienelactone hydrolase